MEPKGGVMLRLLRWLIMIVLGATLPSIISAQVMESIQTCEEFQQVIQVRSFKEPRSPEYGMISFAHSCTVIGNSSHRFARYAVEITNLSKEMVVVSFTSTSNIPYNNFHSPEQMRIPPNGTVAFSYITSGNILAIAGYDVYDVILSDKKKLSYLIPGLVVIGTNDSRLYKT